MIEFKVGDYVVYEKGNTTNDNVYKVTGYWDGGKYWEGTVISKLGDPDKHIDVDSVNFRHATVLDYLRTLSAEKVAGIFTNIYLKGQVIGDLSTATEVTREGMSFYSIAFELLNQPLTDELVEQLGGKE